MHRAVLFDWDGTILDSRAALLGAWHAATEAVLGRRFPVTAHDIETCLTHPGKLLFPQVAGDAADALAAAFREAYRRTGAEVRAFPGMVALLEALRGQGTGIALVTSKARERHALDLARLGGPGGMADVTVCFEDAAAPKPDPAPVLRALELLGVAPADAVMVGDTVADVRAGAAAGTLALGVGWGASGAQALLGAGAAAVAADHAQLRALLLGH